jgi:hypothetical protein
MSLVGLIVALVIIGVVLYLVNLLPMDATVKKILSVVVLLVVILWLLQAFGLWTTGPFIVRR